MFDLSSRQAKIVFVLALLFIGFFLFFPLYWLVISSLKANAELYRSCRHRYPTMPTLEHFITGADERQVADVPDEQPDHLGLPAPAW
jgi:multiple sugar transport system permease protein